MPDTPHLNIPKSYTQMMMNILNALTKTSIFNLNYSDFLYWYYRLGNFVVL